MSREMVFLLICNRSSADPFKESEISGSGRQASFEVALFCRPEQGRGNKGRRTPVPATATHYLPPQPQLRHYLGSAESRMRRMLQA